MQERKAKVICLKIAMGCEVFKAQFDIYPASLSDLAEMDENIIQESLALAVNEESAKAGYYYRYSRKVDGSNFSLYAKPVDSQCGVFFIDNSLIIRLNDAVGEELASPLDTQ